jgi:hypothetical protein
MYSIIFKGKPVSDDASKVCVLYDPKDGRVIHVHGVTIMHGGKEVSRAEIEQRAMARAKALGRSVEGVKPLHLPLSAIRQRGGFKVNTDGTGLVPSRAPEPARQLLAQNRKNKGGKRR